MKIRRAKFKDAKQVAKLYLQFWEVHKKNPLHQPHWKINYKNCLRDAKEVIKDKEYLLYVAEIDKNVAGCMLFTIKKQDRFFKVKKYGHVEEAVVDRKYRRMGIARKLMQFALNYFKKRGCKYAHIGVEVDLPIALKAWESCGFKPETIELIKELK